VAGDYNADRRLAVVRAVGGIDRARALVEPHLAVDLLFQFGGERLGIAVRDRGAGVVVMETLETVGFGALPKHFKRGGHTKFSSVVHVVHAGGAAELRLFRPVARRALARRGAASAS